MRVLDGLAIRSLKRFADERGFFLEIFRSDWDDLLENDTIVQTNLSITYPGVVRAWHQHERGQTDYFIVMRGAAKICAWDEEAGELDEIISTGVDPQVVKVPGHYWHGFKAFGNEPVLMIYFVNRLYDYRKPDEKRRPWDDPAIIPRNINGKGDDARCNKPWSWLYLPYK